MRIGDVYRYKPESSWCRDETAIVLPGYDGKPALVDTFWADRLDFERVMSNEPIARDFMSLLNEGHRPSDSEKESLSFQFNVRDYALLGRNAAHDVYEPDDVVMVTSQHGAYRFYFVKPALEERLAWAIVEGALQASDGTRPIDEDDALGIARHLLHHDFSLVITEAS